MPQGERLQDRARARHKMAFRKCSVEGCEKPRKSHGGRYCSMHSARHARHGDVNALRPNKKTERFIRDVVLKYEGDGCLLWPFGDNGEGYGRMNLNGQHVQVHRVICEIVNGPPPTPIHQAAHSCGRGHLGCCSPKHLSWKTPAENAADMIVHGTVCRGERSARAKLKESDVLEIRRLAGNVPHKLIAETFNIHRKYIPALVSGKRWGHLR